MDRSSRAPHVAHPFYTIGHSTRAIREFVELLRAYRINRVIDVRTIPRSRTNAQYNSVVLAESLASFQIGYQHIKALGGLRSRKLDVPKEVNALWENKSFHNYADYAISPEFRFGLEQLRAAGRAAICAIMCAEVVWWRCHRRIIADHLIASGETVVHILGQNSAVRAQLTQGACVGANGVVSYPSVGEYCSNKDLAAKR